MMNGNWSWISSVAKHLHQHDQIRQYTVNSRWCTACLPLLFTNYLNHAIINGCLSWMNTARQNFIYLFSKRCLRCFIMCLQPCKRSDSLNWHLICEVHWQRDRRYSIHCNYTCVHVLSFAQPVDDISQRLVENSKVRFAVHKLLDSSEDGMKLPAAALIAP